MKISKWENAGDDTDLIDVGKYSARFGNSGKGDIGKYRAISDRNQGAVVQIL